MSAHVEYIGPHRLGLLRVSRITALQRRARAAMLGLLSRLEDGELTVVEPDGAEHRFGRATADGLCARMMVQHPGMYVEASLRGTLGAAEAHIAGWWNCDDMTSLVRLLVRNQAALERMDHRLAIVLTPLRKALDWLRPRGRRASRRDIHAHYDLSNQFFALFLDPTMMYSCAVFERPDMTLQEASLAKMERVCKAIDLGPDDHLLEIGTGWGGFAIHAAATRGCRVTTVTISEQQAKLARQRVAQAGLSHRVEILERDYRDIAGTYDKLVSIEMIEAVGAPGLSEYIRRCGALLKPDGAMLLQAIVIADQYYDRAKARTDFLKKHIFPGSFLPSVSAIADAVKRESDLRIARVEDIGLHYVHTLNAWRENFTARLDEVRALGMDERFIRLWMFYFHYCAGTFAERRASDVQMTLIKPRCRLEWPAPSRPAGLPRPRARAQETAPA